MSTINVSGSTKKKKKTTESVGLDKEKVLKDSIGMGKNLGLGLLALAIAATVYFLTKIYLVPDIAIWAREIISFILSLLVLGGFSAVSKKESKIGGSVVLFLFAIFIWQLVSGYSDYEIPQENNSKKRNSRIEVLSLTPREEPYIFHLSEIGDETEPFRAQYDGRFNFNIKSHDYGFEIININESKLYRAYSGKTLPETKNPILVVRATKPNQNILVTLSTR